MNDQRPFFEEDARELYEDAPCGYLSSLFDGTIMSVNRTFLQWTGYSREDLLAGTRFQDLLAGPGKIFYETQYLPLLHMQGFVKEVALDLVCKKRNTLPVILNSAACSATSGRPAYVRSTLFDATARRRYESDLLHARKRLEAEVHQRTSELEQEVAERSKAEVGLKELTSKLLSLQDDERRRLARELHDSVGQLLAATSMSLGAISADAANLGVRAQKSLADAVVLIEQSLKEIRVVSYLLHPPSLDECGLESALQWYLDGFSERSSVRAELVVGRYFPRLPQELETAVFRIVQECLTNIHRHSGSKTATVKLDRLADSVRIEIADSGKGMSSDLSHGVGLRGMRERIGQFRGKMEIRSGAQGTTIIAEIPFSEKNE